MTRKWANIRKYYTDEVRKPATDSPAKKKQRRQYHHLLTFLDDSVNKRRIQRIQEFKNIGREEVENDSSSDSESNELYIVEDANELEKMQNSGNSLPDLNPEPYVFDDREVKVTEVPNPIFAKPNVELKPTVAQASAKNPEIMKLLNDAPKVLPNTPWVPTARPRQNYSMSLWNKTSLLDLTAEASKKFLLSLLPEIMSLNVKQNMKFRLGILDLLDEIKCRVTRNA